MINSCSLVIVDGGGRKPCRSQILIAHHAIFPSDRLAGRIAGNTRSGIILSEAARFRPGWGFYETAAISRRSLDKLPFHYALGIIRNSIERLEVNEGHGAKPPGLSAEG